MRVLILGGTGPAGQALIRAALAHGLMVVVYARSPEVEGGRHGREVTPSDLEDKAPHSTSNTYQFSLKLDPLFNEKGVRRPIERLFVK